MNRSLRLCVFVAQICGFLGACAFGRLTPGLTKEGAAVAVSAPSLEEARSRAVASVSELYAAPHSAPAAKISELLRARAAEFVGRARFKAGKGVVEVKIDKLARVLDRAGLLRPEGFGGLSSNAAKNPRVLLLVAEPESLLDLGVGPAADALRRGLTVYGLTAIDGRDSLNNFSSKGKGAIELAAKLGANWVLIAAAESRAQRDPESGAWRANASLVGRVLTTSGVGMAGTGTVVAGPPSSEDEIRSDAAVLDVSSAAARNAALDEAGTEAAARVAEQIARAKGGRSEAAVFVTGNADLPRLKALLSALRKTEGVLGAFLVTWRSSEESAAILRVFLVGIKTDGLAARLLRRDPMLTSLGLSLLSVEPDDGRLAVEISDGSGGREE